MRHIRRPDAPAWAILAVIAGAALRAAALPLTGTTDVEAWKVWSYAAVTAGPAHVYGDERPPQRHFVTFGQFESVVNYPPLAIDELAVVGRAYASMHGGVFRDGLALTVTIRSAIVAVDAALAALLFAVVRQLRGRRHAWWCAAAFWISPAALLMTALGYIDVFFVLPAIGALVAASQGWPIAAGALFAAAVMTKPQALFIGPAVALAIWNAGAGAGARRRLTTAAISGTIVAIALTLPVLFAGTLLNLGRALGSLAFHDMLSGTAANLWWIVGYGMQLANASRAGAPLATGTIADIVPISALSNEWWLHPRLVGLALVAIASAWALWIARQARDLGLFAAVAAFMVFAYFILSAQVHENHGFVAIPLLALAAALSRRFAPVLAAVGTTMGLNLYLFYGVRGMGPPEIARTVTLVDSTVVLSIVNCALLGWFAMVLRSACQSSDHRGAATAGKATVLSNAISVSDHQ